MGRRAWGWLIGVAAVVGGIAGAVTWASWYYPPPDFFGSEVARRVTWDRYSDEYKEAVAYLHAQGSTDEYGLDLPDEYAFLVADGFVSTSSSGEVFFPLWLGIPDDAGGYFYSPNESPEGWDMYGMVCQDPTRLDEDWWKCGMG